MKTFVLAAALLGVASIARAAPPAASALDAVAALPDGLVLDSTTNSVGQRITVPAHPELHVAVFTDPAGWHSMWHMHRYPRYVYVLEGRLTVETPDGRTKSIPAGHFSAEMIGRWHRGENLGSGPVKFLVIDQVVPGSGPNMVKRATPPKS